jgi:hypothetical protein
MSTTRMGPTRAGWAFGALGIFLGTDGVAGALDSGGMVQFQGSLQFVQRPLEGDPVVEHLRFRAEVGGCRWRIRTAQTDFDLTSPTGAYYSYAYDGVDLYRFCSLGPGPVSGKSDLGDPIQKTGMISRGGVFPVRLQPAG